MSDTQSQTTPSNDMNDIAARVSAFINDNLLLGRALDLASIDSFLEAGVIDSTGVLELVQFVEETFGFEVSDEEMIPENLDSLDNIVVFIERRTLPHAVD